MIVDWLARVGRNLQRSTYAAFVVADTSSAATASGSPSRPDADVDADAPIQFTNVQIPTRPINDFRLPFLII